MNPYEVLGVSQNATKEEIHDAYRKLVKKNHPDKFTDPQMKKVAEEKIKQINEAYDLIKDGNYNPYSSRARSSGYSYSTSTTAGSAEFQPIRQMINNGNIQGAYSALSAMANHTAEWHYLMGIVLLRMGRYDNARSELRFATQMDPGNSEYAQAYASLLNFGGRYRTTYTNSGSSGCCNVCTASICANLLCGGLDGCCCTCC